MTVMLFVRLLLIPLLAVAGGVLPASAEGPFVGQFELKNLESAPGYLEFQSQNAVSVGEPRRRIAPGGSGEPLYDENSVARQRHALEMEMGFTRFLKMRVGIEYEKERVDEPGSPAAADDFNSLTLSEIGGEVIVVLIPREGDGFGLGVVTEAEHPLGHEEPNVLIMGPILELAAGPWSASFIPMGVTFVGGDREDGEARDNKWDFAYATQLMYQLSSDVSLGIEAYGTIDRISGTGHPGAARQRFGDHDQHRLGPIVYLSRPLDDVLSASAPVTKSGGDAEAPELTIGLGVFAGLTESTPDATGKLSLEIDF